MSQKANEVEFESGGNRYRIRVTGSAAPVDLERIREYVRVGFEENRSAVLEMPEGARLEVERVGDLLREELRRLLERYRALGCAGLNPVIYREVAYDLEDLLHRFPGEGE